MKNLIQNIKMVFRYWIKIIVAIFIDLYKYLKEHILGGFLLLFGYFVFIVFSSQAIDYSIKQGFIGDMEGWARTLWAVAPLSIIYFIGAILYKPAKLDEGQRDKIEKLISVNDKILVEKFDYYNPFDYKDFKTGITIHNKNPVPFTDVVIELLETNWRKLDQEGNVFLTEKIGVLADNSHFKNWANGNIKAIGAKDKETIYLHQVEKGVVVALLENRKEFFEHKNFSTDGKAIGFIEIVFEVRGKVGEENFEKRYVQLIEYRRTKIKEEKNDVITRISTIDTRSFLASSGKVFEISGGV